MHVVQPPTRRHDDAARYRRAADSISRALALHALAAIRCERILSLAVDRAKRIVRYVHSEPIVHALETTRA
jgi:hypothetical protein